MNICYGGSFNPPTIAHIKVVEKLKAMFNPQNLIIIPTGDSYHLKEMTSFYHRFNMLKLTFPKDIILDIESLGNKYCGTLNTLNLLSKDYDDLYFCMGADNLITIKTWIKYEELLSKYKFIVFKRNDIDLEAYIENNISKYKNNITIVDFDNDISSTMFRQNKIKELVDEKTYNYILENNLYEED